jgi:hypothetical protein
MFGPSLKSVPGCFVSIVPILIGVPVAFTPGLGPHEEVSVDPLLLPPPLDEDPPPADALLLELLLLPHPARAISATAAARATRSRTRGTLLYVLTDFLLSSRYEPAPASRGTGRY